MTGISENSAGGADTARDRHPGLGRGRCLWRAGSPRRRNRPARFVDERLHGNPGRITTRSPFSSRFTRAITLSIVLSLFPIQAAQAAQVKEATFP